MATHLKTLLEFLLLLVDYSKAKVDFVGLFKVGFHAHNLRKGFFCMFKRTVAVVENTYAVPQLGFLTDS